MGGHNGSYLGDVYVLNTAKEEMILHKQNLDYDTNWPRLTASPNRGSTLGSDHRGWLIHDIYDVTIVAWLLYI